MTASAQTRGSRGGRSGGETGETLVAGPAGVRHVCTDRGVDDEKQAAAGLALAGQAVYVEAAGESRQGLVMARCSMYCTLSRSESRPISRSRRGRRRARWPK